MREVYVDCGNGGYVVTTWTGLWAAIWESVAWAMSYRAAGNQCAECGCLIESCEYCARGH